MGILAIVMTPLTKCIIERLDHVHLVPILFFEMSIFYRYVVLITPQARPFHTMTMIRTLTVLRP